MPRAITAALASLMRTDLATIAQATGGRVGYRHENPRGPGQWAHLNRVLDMDRERARELAQIRDRHVVQAFTAFIRRDAGKAREHVTAAKTVNEQINQLWWAFMDEMEAGVSMVSHPE